MKHYENSYQDCYVKQEGNVLRIGNDSIERAWDMGKDIPVVLSLKNKRTQKEWISASENYGMLDNPRQKYAFYKEAITESGRLKLQVTADVDDDCGISRKALRVVVGLEYVSYKVEWIHMVYPQSPVMRSYLQVTIKEGVTISEKEIEPKGQLFHSPEYTADFSDNFPLLPTHCRWENVRFIDRTDYYDNLVESTHGLIHRREQRYLQGNLLMVEDCIGEEGVTFIKEGPTVFSHLGDMKCDFFMDGQNVITCGWGLEERDFQREETLTSYGSAVVLWDGDKENKNYSLGEYHSCRHAFVPEKDAFLMSNTWGDMSDDGKISETFLLEELKRAKEIGINFYQIDDGWQQGTTGNSINAQTDPTAAWGKAYYKSNPRFWEVNETRLPNGLKPIVNYAKENGIRIGLWFSPDSENDFENWEKDSSVLLDLYHKYGISAFKMDGIKLESKVSEENLGRLLRRVVTESNGEVFFNMDTTAEVRSGFFGRVQYGSLFLENRFTGIFGKWPNYYPHCTLRNLWMLSRYYPTNRLQIEFLNVGRNTELYGDDVLAPAVCGQEYSFAVTMFANPLAWLELTGLDEESTETLKRLIPPYLKIQGDILSGHVLPIGEEPDGTGWTGFQSVKEAGSGYLLIIKERNQLDTHPYILWKEKGKTLKLESLLGYGTQNSVDVDEEGRAVFALEGQLKYALYRYSVE